MENNNTTNGRTGVLYPSANHEETLADMLAADLAELFHHQPSEGYVWTDTQTALIEACYLAWTSGRLHDRTGHKMAFRHIVNAACNVLHVRIPRNPSAAIYKARMRKEIRIGSLDGRYRLLQGHGVRDPFRLNVMRSRRKMVRW